MTFEHCSAKKTYVLIISKRLRVAFRLAGRATCMRRVEEIANIGVILANIESRLGKKNIASRALECVQVFRAFQFKEQNCRFEWIFLSFS